ncbi:DUF1189 family protein [Liberiplasma polymorphum]|uniref:DUF1189 family protein n=1 Tax=Liberiplasma polymorphum TaxID=3374570 RepID=UPI003771650C
MLNRVRASLVDPAQLINYRKDSLLKVWGYLLFFAVLMSTSTLINVINFQGINQQLQTALRENTIALESSCEISNATLVCDETIDHTLIELENFNVVINSSETLSLSDYRGFNYYFVVHDETLYLVFMGNIVRTKPLVELHEDSHNFALNFTPETRNDFYTTLFDTIDKEMLELRVYWGPLLMITSILSALFLFSVFVIINTLISRTRVKQVSFRHMYVMMTYAATSLYIVLIFESMLRFSIFLFILLLFIAFRQMSKLTLEIYMRVNKN